MKKDYLCAAIPRREHSPSKLPQQKRPSYEKRFMKQSGANPAAAKAIFITNPMLIGR